MQVSPKVMLAYTLPLYTAVRAGNTGADLTTFKTVVNIQADTWKMHMWQKGL